MASGSQNLTSYQANKWTNLRAFTIGGTSKNVDGTAAVSWSATEILGSSDSTKFYRGDKTWSDTLTAGLNAAYIGITNTDSTTGYGLSLYNGASAGAPSYGIFFGGTATFGTHGSVTGSWATYFTMNEDTSRGWIFRCGSTNVASISGGGTVQLNGALTLSGDINLKTSSADSPDIVWWYGNTDTEQARIWTGSGSTSKWAPYYRCYDSNGTSLYRGNLVLGDGTGAGGSWGISVTGSSASCTGNALTCSYPQGFNSRGTGATWGNTTGTSITYWGTSSGGCIDFRNDNPSSGKISIKVDGRFYGNEGTYPAMLMKYENSYWGMGTPDAGNDWIRTTTQGIIPSQSGGIGGGHCGLGTSSWYFSYVYSDNVYCARVSANGGNLGLGNANNAGWVLAQDICSQTAAGDSYWSARTNGTGHFKAVYGAVWNDYAEMRNVPEAQINIQRIYDDKGEIERDYPYAGRCVQEIGNGQMKLTNSRLAKGCKIISDTFGFCIGETEECCTPIAVTGRVLAYPLESIEMFESHIGDCVCSGPNGTISIMTNEEKIKYPECIIGTISEIPTYKIWYCGNAITKPIHVDGRIWIYVR